MSSYLDDHLHRLKRAFVWPTETVSGVSPHSKRSVTGLGGVGSSSSSYYLKARAFVHRAFCLLVTALGSPRHRVRSSGLAV